MARLTACLAAALAAGGCLDGQPVEPDQPEQYVVGLLAPVTGTGAAVGKQSAQGAQLAIDIANGARPDLPLPSAVGRIVRAGGSPAAGGRSARGAAASGPAASGTDGTSLAPFRLAIGDTQAQSDVADQQADRLADAERAAAIVIGDGQDVIRAASRRTDALGVALIDVSSTDGTVGSLRSRYFRTAPADQDLLGAAFGVIQQQRARGYPMRRIAVLQPGGGRGSTLIVSLRQMAVEAGCDVVGTVAYGEPPAAVDGLANQLRNATPDVVFAAATTAAEATAAGQIAERLRDRASVIAVGPAAQRVAGVGANPSVMRVVGWSDPYVSKNPTARSVAEFYQQRFGSAMTETAAGAFTAVLTVVHAVLGAGRGDKEGAYQALRRVSVPATMTVMPWDGVRFDGYGRNELAGALVEQASPGGFRVVFPAELAGGAAVWPSPSGPGRASGSPSVAEAVQPSSR